MKKNVYVLFIVTILTLIFSSCKTNNETQTVDNNISVSTVPTEHTVQQDNSFFVDETSDLGNGYKLCYQNENLTGNVGVAGATTDGYSILIDPNYSSITCISEDKFIVRKFIDEHAHSALIDNSGKELIPLFRGEIRCINNDDETPILSVEQFPGNCKFYDISGHILYDETFTLTGRTNFGWFYGIKEKEYFLFSNNGEFIKSVKEGEEFTTTEISPEYYLRLKNKGNKLEYGLVDKTGKAIVPCDYDDITLFSNGLVYARKGDLYGWDYDDEAVLYDCDGKQLTESGMFSAITYDEKSNVLQGYKYEKSENGRLTTEYHLNEYGQIIK